MIGHVSAAGSREPFTPTDRIDIEVDRIYQRVQLPADLVARIETELRAEIAVRQRRTVDERDWHTARPPTAYNANRIVLIEAPTVTPASYRGRC